MTINQECCKLKKVTHQKKHLLTCDDVIANTEQFKLPRIELYFIAKYAVMLKLVMYRTHYPGPAGYCHFCLISGSGRILI